jgi:hypothetical protein
MPNAAPSNNPTPSVDNWAIRSSNEIMHQHIRRSGLEYVASDGQNDSLENENDNGRFPTMKQANASAPERMSIDKNAIDHE